MSCCLTNSDPSTHELANQIRLFAGRYMHLFHMLEGLVPVVAINPSRAMAFNISFVHQSISVCAMAISSSGVYGIMLSSSSAISASRPNWVPDDGFLVIIRNAHELLLQKGPDSR